MLSVPDVRIKFDSSRGALERQAQPRPSSTSAQAILLDRGNPVLKRSIPADEQIDALLAGNLGPLLKRYRLSLETLRPRWTVSVDDILSRARMRGLESFVLDAPPGDGVYLVRNESGYEVAVVDHGCQLSERRFPSLDAAFRHWVEARLGGARLPHDGGR